MGLGLEKLGPASGATRPSKRIGRGPGSGVGKTAGRGHKGAKSRSGYSLRRGFEGGQMPLQRRLPKRGFTNKFRKVFSIVSLSQLDTFDAGSEITVDSLVQAKIVKAGRGVKVLANGEISKSLTVKVDKVSAKAKELIEGAGGSVVTSEPAAE